MRGGNLKDNEAGGGLGGRAQRLPPQCTRWWTEIPLLLFLLLPLLLQGA